MRGVSIGKAGRQTAKPAASCSRSVVLADDRAVAVRIHDIVKRYPGSVSPANDGISLEIRVGEVFGILGSNGAGKTTLVQQLLNRLPPTAGEIELFGNNVKGNPRRVRELVGYQAQDASPLPHLTLNRALDVTARLRGLPRRLAREEARRLIELWDLRAVAHKQMGTLSSGEHRLGCVALAMAADPPLVVLDEPTAALDPARRRRVWEVLSELSSRGTTVVLVTHDAVEAENVVERVALIRNGRVAAIGRPGPLKAVLGDRLRLDLTLDPGGSSLLPCGPRWHNEAPSRFFALLGPEEITGVLGEIDLSAVDGICLRSATLEDLYLHYSGG